jgi:hypothetical protein
MKKYGLSIVLLALFLGSWLLQTWFGWQEYVSESQLHGAPAEVLDYFWSWGEATFENWQSEFLQLLTFVLLSTYLIHKGSPQSKDGSERMERKLDALLREQGKDPNDY